MTVKVEDQRRKEWRSKTCKSSHVIHDIHTCNAIFSGAIEKVIHYQWLNKAKYYSVNTFWLLKVYTMQDIVYIVYAPQRTHDQYLNLFFSQKARFNFSKCFLIIYIQFCIYFDIGRTCTKITRTLLDRIRMFDNHHMNVCVCVCSVSCTYMLLSLIDMSGSLWTHQTAWYSDFHQNQPWQKLEVRFPSVATPCGRWVDFFGYSISLHQFSWRNLNIAEMGV